jgi:hypothetical protein
MARNRFPRGAGRVGLKLVVTGDGKHSTCNFDANLSGTENVTCGMQRDASSTDSEGMRVVKGLKLYILAEPESQKSFALGCSQVGLRATASVIGVSVGDDCFVYREPGIDIEIAGGAV